jgi:hypothetical protein
VSIYSLLDWINARMDCLVDSDRLGQTLINILRLASAGANCAASVPDSVPPVSESVVFPGVCGAGSTPVGPTGFGQAEIFGWMKESFFGVSLCVIQRTENIRLTMRVWSSRNFRVDVRVVCWSDPLCYPKGRKYSFDDERGLALSRRDPQDPALQGFFHV